jgi:hypothetical protein
MLLPGGSLAGKFRISHGGAAARKHCTKIPGLSPAKQSKHAKASKSSRDLHIGQRIQFAILNFRGGKNGCFME